MVEYDFLLEELKRILKEKQLKFTRQRELVLKALYENDGHFSPEEIHRLIQADAPETRVGIATVYRTLSLLEEEKLADSLSFGKAGKRYEIGMKKHHDHLICTRCGKIIEFCDETIEKQQEAVAKKFDFEMTDHAMKIIGICKECRQNE
ncbi:Fur family transcriptional regulator, partial [Nitratifractor sp.]